MSIHTESAVIRLVLEGDPSVIYDELSTIVWITRFDAVSKGSWSIWTITLQGSHVTPTDLLRVVMADRRLQVIEFVLIQLPAGA